MKSDDGAPDIRHARQWLTDMADELFALQQKHGDYRLGDHATTLRDVVARARIEEPLPGATISFHGEAYDTAADHFRQAAGWIVLVVPAKPGEAAETTPFDARVGELIVGDDGQWKATLHPTDDLGEDLPVDALVLDIYDDIDRIEVY